jgi:hypothetical protein
MQALPPVRFGGPWLDSFTSGVGARAVFAGGAMQRPALFSFLADQLISKDKGLKRGGAKTATVFSNLPR